MNTISEEQSVILEKIKTKKNVIVDAIAGSGKSTTILSIAKALADVKVLQMTYNAMLRHEIKEKTKVLDIKNIEVHTFHSIAVKYYDLSAHTDTAMRHLLYNNTPPRIKIPEFQLLVLDEAQDMTFLYFQFIVKVTRDMGGKFQLLVLGDYKQGLYEFKGADTRFLTMADQIWHLHPQLIVGEFERCTLKMSYRITKPMAQFVNQVMLGEERMFSEKEGEPVHYYRQSRYNTEKFVVYQINQLRSMGAKPSDFFVIGSSVKGPKSNIRKMENALVENNIPCHVPMIEGGENIDEKVIEGKVVFSTFHCVKGRQRPYVFVVGFDNSYYYNAKTASKTSCPNTLYVGTTRASKGMYLLEKKDYDTDRPLEFLKMSHTQMKQAEFIDFKGISQTIFYERRVEKGGATIPRHNVTPTDLIKFIPESVIEEITPLLDRLFVKQPTDEPPKEIDLPTILKTRQGFHEDISDLNGIAIPSIYYDHIQKRCKTESAESNILLKMIRNNMGETRENEHRFLKNIIAQMHEKCTRISDYLYAANVYVATQEKLYFKLKQIESDEYTWLSRDAMIQCIKRLDSHIISECKQRIPIFEQVLIDYAMDEEHRLLDEVLRPFFPNPVEFRFSARLDLVTEKSVWEIKCTSKITIDHLLQVIIYAWLWRILVADDRNIRILNIKTGEVLELQATNEELTQIMIALLKGKYCEPVIKTDEEFVRDCCEIFSKV